MSIHDITKRLQIYWQSNKEMRIPSFLNKYEIAKKIAETEFCVVVSAQIKKSTTKYAIKCIPLNFYRKHQNEIEIITKISHPNIIQCIDSFQYPSKKGEKPRLFAIVMPCASSDLVGRIRFGGYIEEPIACKIMHEILSAIKYLHDNNIIHRDLKCDNIFVMQDDADGIRIAIGDFGLSIWGDGSPINGLPVGTALYAPPELLIQNKESVFGISFNNHKVTCLFMLISIIICSMNIEKCIFNDQIIIDFFFT